MLPSGWTTNRPGPTCAQPFNVRPSSRGWLPVAAPVGDALCAPAGAAATSRAHRARLSVRWRFIGVGGSCVVVNISEPILARRTKRGVQTALHQLRLDRAVPVRVDAIQDLLEQLAHPRRMLPCFGHDAAVARLENVHG